MSAARSKKHIRPAERRARTAAARQAAARAERLHWAVSGGAGLVFIAVIVAAAVYANRRDSTRSALPHSPAAADTALPPWPAPADPSAGIKRAGLRSGNAEGTAEHFHAHLDILIRGSNAPVAANVGINASTGELAELHTHDTTGILHIEAPDTKRRYVLGQLFTEWGVRLDDTHLGGLTAMEGSSLRAYVDGKKINGDPAAVELKAHREIALVYGPKGAAVDVPDSYAFPPGD